MMSERRRTFYRSRFQRKSYQGSIRRETFIASDVENSQRNQHVLFVFMKQKQMIYGEVFVKLLRNVSMLNAFGKVFTGITHVIS